MKNFPLPSLLMLLTLAVLCCIFSYANAKEVPFPQCPQKLAVKQDIQQPISEGWETTNSVDEHPLIGTYITFGDYSNKRTGHLIPSEEKKLSNGDLIAFYDYIGGSKSEIFGYWITCRYARSAVILTQKLPASVRRCEVKRFNSNGPVLEAVKCFDTPRKTR
jgi:hypothetical protein